jgi:VanZ family protein
VTRIVPVSSKTLRILAVGAVGLYALFLFTLTHLPRRPPDVLSLPGVPHQDKVGHAAAFASLALFTCAVVSLFQPLSIRGLVAVGLGLIGYAALDEYTQGWVPLRTPDPLDWLADIAGILAGLALFVILRWVIRSTTVKAPSAIKLPPS